MSFEDLHTNPWQAHGVNPPYPPFPPPPLPPTVTTLDQAKAIIAADERRQFMELLARMDADKYEFNFGLLDPDDPHRHLVQMIHLHVDGTWEFV